jgi:hypothetical protein
VVEAVEESGAEDGGSEDDCSGCREDEAVVARGALVDVLGVAANVFL